MADEPTDDITTTPPPEPTGGGVVAGVVTAPTDPEAPVGGGGEDGGRRGRRFELRGTTAALFFVAPAAVLLGALVVYPIVYTVIRSLFDADGNRFVALGNYVDMFQNDRTLRAIKNNLVWVVIAPTVATGVGLIYAVLAERVRWETAFKVAVFMPMAISGLATGVIFRLVYEENPDRGVANAVVTSIGGVFGGDGGYLTGARPSDKGQFAAAGQALLARQPGETGSTASYGLLAIAPDDVPDSAVAAKQPTEAAGDAIAGLVWLDFAPGGGGEKGAVDPKERGLPGVKVEAVRDGEVVGSATTEDDGSFTIDGLERGSYRISLAESNFKEPFAGFGYLDANEVIPGVNVVTLAIIASWLWIWIGFAMIVIGAGLSAIPRDVLEAARVDGASEWQVFRRVTAPLLTPVLLVVLVTLVINVLKIFDLVLVVAPGSVQDDASVIALDIYRVSFSGSGADQGLGSALSILLFLLVVPAMAFNIKRFRSENR